MILGDCQGKKILIRLKVITQSCLKWVRLDHVIILEEGNQSPATDTFDDFHKCSKPGRNAKWCAVQHDQSVAVNKHCHLSLISHGCECFGLKITAAVFIQLG